MFADSILETSDFQRSRRSLTTLTSFALQGLIAAMLLLFPLFHPEALPSLHRISTPVSLGRPFEQPLAVHTATGSATSILLNSPTAYRLRMPSRMPTSMLQASDDPASLEPIGSYIPGTVGLGDPNGVRGLFANTAAAVMPKPTPTLTTQRIRISQMNPGSLIHSVQPAYPPLARSARISGAVMMSAIISKDGTIANLRVVSGHPMLTAAAIDAVRQWRYRPYILNGEPVEVETQITVNFSLSGS